MELLPILHLNQFDFQEGNPNFYANQFIPHVKEHHTKIAHPHKHDFYLVVLFTKGSGKHEIDFTSYDIQAGSVFFMTPGQTHYWELSDDIDGWIFFHSSAFYNQHFQSKKVQDFPFYFSLQNRSILQLEETDIDSFEHQFKELYTEFISNQLYKKSKIISLVNQLYIDLARKYVTTTTQQRSNNPKNVIRIQQLEQLIDLHFKEKKSPRQYADLLNISTKHLNRLVQNTLGKTTLQFINERVIIEAKRLLVTNTYSISEVCFHLGLDDPSYFSRFFKKHSGSTPSEFTSTYHD